MKFIESSAEKNSELENIYKEVGLDKLANVGVANLGNIPPARKTSDYLKSAVGWVYSCVNAIADEVAMMNLRLYKKAGKDAKEVESHPALDLLYKVNEFTTKFDFLSMITQYLELTGEAPLYVSKKQNRPDKMLLLRPDRLTVKNGTDGNILNGYEYEVEAGKKVNLDLDEVIFLRYPDPNKPFRGAGPLQAVARTVDIDEYSEEYNKKFFYNSARPDSAIETDQKLNESQLKKLTQKFEQKYKGLDNSHKTIILQAGLKYKPISISQKDMDFMEQQKFSRDKILGIFRVPRTVLGITDDVNRANAEASDYVFAKRTIKPKMERIVQQLNEFYLPMFAGTESMYFDFDSPVPEDLTAKRDWQKSGLEKGWITVNEAREADGLSPVGEEADKLRLPMGLQEIETYDEADGGFEMLSVPYDRARQVSRRERKAESVKILKEELEKTLTKLILSKQVKGIDVIEAPKETPIVEIGEDEKKMLEFQNKQLTVADEYEKKFKTRFNDIFEQQKKEVLAKLDKKELKPKDFLLSLGKEKKRYIRELAELFSAMIVSQSKEAFNFIGIDDEFSLTNPNVTQYLSKRAFKFATPVTRETNRRLANELSEGINAGESIPKLQDRVESIFGDMKATRSERIARSETIRATNYASEQAYIESGVVEGKRWLTALDDRTCEFCDEMNGEVVELGESFADRGETFVGRDGGTLPIDYETVEHPPLHPDCRCTLIPIVSKDMKAPEQKEADKKEDVLSKLDPILDSMIKELSNEE